MELEEKIRFALSTLKPMAVGTLPFLCQVLGTNDRKNGDLIGSGLRCILDGRRAIVTAAHVFERGYEKFKDLAVSAGHGVQPYLVHGAIPMDAVADLAIYYLPEDYSVPEGCSFWPESRIDPTLDRLSTDYLFVHGFPGVRSQRWIIPGDSRVMSKSLPYGVMQRLDPGVDLDPPLTPFQFAMDFEPSNARAESGLPESELFEKDYGPEGLSGSPVWRIGASGKRAADWSFDWCELVGVVKGWYSEEKLLVATKVTKLLELVDRSRKAAKETQG